jgi:curli biogenesis system outer membrane secretion channel CsgG
MKIVTRVQSSTRPIPVPNRAFQDAHLRACLHAMAVGGLLAGMASCQTAGASVTSSGGPSMDEAKLTPYDGPRARIAISDFEDKTSDSGSYRADFGRGLADMLSTALFQSNRFVVLDRTDIGAVLDEQDFGTSGRVQAATAPALGRLEGAELLVKAAITGFEPDAGGISTGGVSILGGVLGGIAGGAKKACVSMDLKVVEVRTGRIVAATSVAGEAKSFSVGFEGAGSSLGGGLGIYAKGPMETAIRKMIQAAVNFIGSQTPAQYFHDPVEAAPQTAVAVVPSAADPVEAPRTLPEESTIQTVNVTNHKDILADLVSIQRKRETIIAKVRLRFAPGIRRGSFTNRASSGGLLDYDSGEEYFCAGLNEGYYETLDAGQSLYLYSKFVAVPEAVKHVQLTIGNTAVFEDVVIP